ncbi:MAG: amidohydrolase family protein [Alphaproteobacteria bacterium]
MAGPVPGSADLVVRNAAVLDGTGAPAFVADVAVSGGRIAAIGDLGRTVAVEDIDAAGLTLAPGFIDVHTHDDRYLIDDPGVPAKASQGVTTVVTGNCGISVAPLRKASVPPAPFDLIGPKREDYFADVAAYMTAVERAGPAVNAAVQVGHSLLRHDAMDRLDRPARDDEIAAMQRALGEAMEAGAIGLSSGLFYPPARAATEDEVAAVASAMAPFGGLYTAHIRNEAEGVVDAVEEAASIGRRAGVRAVVSHHKCMGRANWGRTRETLALFDRLREGQRIGLDVYPYTAGSTSLLPEMIAAAERTVVTWSRARPEVAGRDLADIAAEMGLAPLDAARALQPAGALYFLMDDADVARVLAWPHAMIGSDGLPADEHPHPRLWGTFPRVLGHYVRERGVLSLADAVHRMTGLAAAEFGLADRGTLRVGAWADLVLFDPATVADRATYEEPRRPAGGIALVAVNGEPVWRDGRPTGARPGRVLRPAARRGV